MPHERPLTEACPYQALFSLLQRYIPPQKVRRHLVLSQALPHDLPAYPLELLVPIPLFTPQPCSLDIGGAFVVRSVKETNDAQKDRLRCLHRRPALRSRLVPVLVVLGWVQDRDAEQARRVDVGMERDRRLESQRWR